MTLINPDFSHNTNAGRCHTLAMDELSVNVSVPFPTPREAQVAYQVLKVDSEPKRSGVSKHLEVKEDLLTVRLSCREARKLRVALTSFFESLILVTKTIEKFGPPAPAYNHY